MFNWIQRAAELQAQGEPFALAAVIGATAPTSAKPVARAIVTSDGTLEGWVGGGCSQDVVIEEALKCIKTGEPQIIKLSPEPDPSANHSTKEILMTCASSGILEIQIEPVLPRTKLLIFGNTPAAQALSRLATVVDFEIAVFAPGATESDFPEGVNFSDEFVAGVKWPGRSVAVVATQGIGDEKALESALSYEPDYITMIASRKKAGTLRNDLEKLGLSSEALAAVKAPAGLDIKAVTPEEIAVSILAEIVQVLRTTAPAHEKEIEPESREEKVIDPICGMTIDPKTAAASSEFNGTTYYFCCGGCKETFDKEPERFAASA